MQVHLDSFQEPISTTLFKGSKTFISFQKYENAYFHLDFTWESEEDSRSQLMKTLKCPIYSLYSIFLSNKPPCINILNILNKPILIWNLNITFIHSFNIYSYYVPWTIPSAEDIVPGWGWTTPWRAYILVRDSNTNKQNM